MNLCEKKLAIVPISKKDDCVGKWGLREGITVPKPAGQYCLDDTEFAHLKDMYAALYGVDNMDSSRQNAENGFAVHTYPFG